MAPDGVPEYGFRLVRKGGRVKFAGEWWQHEDLRIFVGEFVVVRATEYWLQNTEVWTRYPQRDGKRICVMDKDTSLCKM